MPRPQHADDRPPEEDGLEGDHDEVPDDNEPVDDVLEGGCTTHDFELDSTSGAETPCTLAGHLSSFSL